MRISQEEAVQRINEQFSVESGEYFAEYGERFYADFAGLRDRFEQDYEYAIEGGRDFVCVKVPSYYEVYFTLDLVRVALGR